MNLTKLFETQRKLDGRIVEEKGLEGQDLLLMKILALLTELGELANEWRGFKFWSTNQEPRTEKKVSCHACRGIGDFIVNPYTNEKESCGYCEGTGWQENKNPLLEEYVDCLHFILSIGLEDKRFVNVYWTKNTKEKCVTSQFILLFKNISLNFPTVSGRVYLEPVLDVFMGLGEMLGFKWEQIESAYYAKNAVNHDRQNNGY